MPDHVHLIIRPRNLSYSVAAIRQAIKRPVGVLGIEHIVTHAPEWVPRITRTRGSRIERLFWQSGGGYDRNITKSNTLLNMIEYIHLNPVRKNLVSTAVEWKWSSASWYILGVPGPISVDSIPP